MSSVALRLLFRERLSGLLCLLTLGKYSVSGSSSRNSSIQLVQRRGAHTGKNLQPRWSKSVFPAAALNKKRRISEEEHASPRVTAVVEPPFLVKRLSDNAKLPTRGSPHAAGYDIYSAEDTVVPANGKALIDTQLSIAVPPGTYGRVAPRSGLASKSMIDTGAGVIDADYRGVVFVLLFNHSIKDFEVKQGDRIAQLILESICISEVIEVESLDETDRGTNGFGSTGGHSQLSPRKLDPERKRVDHRPLKRKRSIVEPQLLVKRVSDNAKLPTRGSAYAAGYDLYSAEDNIVPAKGKALIDTQLSIAVPPGTYGRVAPRSGLASKFMIHTGAGVIDADYRGVVSILLFNHSDKDFKVEKGDRIAQLVLEEICTPQVEEVESLDVTDRGTNGFGSTGGHSQLPLIKSEG